MDPFITWLTSTFGGAAPDVAAGLGVPPPAPPSTAMPGEGGSVWDPVPLPRPRPADAPQAGAIPAQPAAGAQPNQLANALRGMAAPQVPAAQRVATPSAPRVNDIKTGDLLAMLMASQEGGVPGGRKINPLPGTLGQALNMPRY